MNKIVSQSVMATRYILLVVSIWLLSTQHDALAVVYSQDNASAPPFQLLLEDVESAVSQALIDMQVADHVKASLTSTRKALLYADHQPVEVELATLTHEKKRRSWSANMLIIKDDEVIKAQPISGRYEEQRSLPVLVRRLKKGHIITKDDIEMRFFSATAVRDTTVMEKEYLIGKTPVRLISKDRPIRISEIETPDVMDSGATVHMRYSTPFIQISTVGEALESGGIGDYVRVRNLDSKKVVRAQVMSANEVKAGMGIQ